MRTRTILMQSAYTAHITPAEWRWVIVAAVLLVSLAFLPFVVVAIGGIPDWQFMGMLHNHRDGATYLSKMMVGAQGEWLVRFLHTPEPHGGALIAFIYVILGQVSGFTSVPLLVLFHVARVAAALFMYLAIYQLAASIWMRLRTRRIFFTILSIGAGFGWLYVLITGGDVAPPDMSIPEAFPFYSSLVNIHFPLTLACLAILSSMIITVFRPGAKEEPRMDNGGLVMVLLSLALGFLYPHALIPIGAALTIFIGVQMFRARKINLRDLRWLALLVLPALPMAVYYLAIVAYNPAMQVWNDQNITLAPDIVPLLIGFGLPLILALPGIWRAIVRFEADGDQFMLIWLILILVMMYLPTSIQRRFAVGAMLPIVYFATRSLEDFWFQRVTNRRWRYRLFMLFIPLIALSQIFILFTPILPVLINRPEQSQGLFLQQDYTTAFNWLERRTSLDDVILAAPDVSAWIPGWVGAKVVYGHPYETLDAEAKLAAVRDWYSGEVDSCLTLIEDWNIQYVLAGPQEAMLGEMACVGELRLVARSGSVDVYAP